MPKEKNDVKNPAVKQALIITDASIVEMTPTGLNVRAAGSKAVVKIDAQRKCTPRVGLTFACAAVSVATAATIFWAISRE